jgi:hypothetical protein
MSTRSSSEPSGQAYATPTGQPCPRCVRLDGTIDGSGDCVACGTCLLLIELAWQEVPADKGDERP